MKFKKVSAILAITGILGLSAFATTKLAEGSTAVQEGEPDVINLTAVTSNSGVSIVSAQGDQESLYATFKGVSGANGYNAYVKKGSGSWVKLDTELIRSFGVASIVIIPS